MRNKLLAAIILCLPFSILASDFLKIIPDVSSSGAGCVNNGVCCGISGLFLNPAGLTGVKNNDIVFSHSFLPLSGLDFTEDFYVQYEYIGFAQRVKKSVFGISLSHYHQAPFKSGDIFNSIYSGFLSATFARDFYNFNAGVRLKIIWEVLGEYKANAFALDLGLKKTFEFLKLYKDSLPNFLAGFSIYNLGSSLVMYSIKEPLPVNVQAGYSYTFFKNSYISFLLANDLKYYFSSKELYRYLEFDSGIEFTFFNMMLFRAGYISFTGSSINRFTLGMGIWYKISAIELNFDYSLIKSTVLNDFNTHSVSITFKRTKLIEKTIGTNG